VIADLGLDTTFETFGAVAAALALVVAASAWRLRPAPADGVPVPGDAPPV